MWLNVADYLLKIIEKDHPNDCEGCCSKMLQEWLEMSSDASWEVLIDSMDKLRPANEGKFLLIQWTNCDRLMKVYKYVFLTGRIAISVVCKRN